MVVLESDHQASVRRCGRAIQPTGPVGDDELVKGVTVIAKGRNTCRALVGQLRGILEGKARVRGLYLDGGIDGPVSDDVVVVSSRIIATDARKYTPEGCRTIVARRCLDYNNLKTLFDLPNETDAILVNDAYAAAIETIDLLKESGIGHLNLTPHAPDHPSPVRTTLAITAGEPHLVPDYVKECIDIGVRLIDITSIVEILIALDLLDAEANVVSARQMRYIVGLLRETRVQALHAGNVKNQLEAILESVDEGIIGTDIDGKIMTCNRAAARLLGIDLKDVLGKKTGDLLPGSAPGLEADRDASRSSGLISVNEKDLVATRAPIMRERQPVGAVFTFRDITEIRRLESQLYSKLVKQGYTSKYSADDIIGTSPAMRGAIELATRIARGNSTVLICGESGSGKELFAHAIHGLSDRRRGPFVPVNFVALPETLLESELFGYEEGAFTGARRGGKPGLFEEAHGGTIFLDEIGDASAALQAKILRVLEEKRIRRVGGTKSISVDVRVMAATNKDLRSLIRAGLFREDLFYRLAVLPLKTPPLRERRQDIPLLIEVFLGRLHASGSRLKISPEAMRLLMEHRWPGNVRELQNVMEYLSNVCLDGVAKPQDIMTVLNLSSGLRAPAILGLLSADRDLALWVLSEAQRAAERGSGLGRRTLIAAARAHGRAVSEGALRRCLSYLRTAGLIEVSRGRGGIRVSELGASVLGDKAASRSQ
ncbi:MAG: sigma 54-interacting transcriptional regulator [Firmicutes bacterium]|nr:sigma 54-interacting transcriptional regulator [Bacillota bacterium]